MPQTNISYVNCNLNRNLKIKSCLKEMEIFICTCVHIYAHIYVVHMKNESIIFQEGHYEK